MAESSNLNDRNVAVVTSGAKQAIADATLLNDSGNNPETTLSVITPNATPEKSKVVMERLARQVEYYFSTTNLEKDTYLATLRSLNDGYVPLSIISKFGKVKALMPTDTLNTVRRAAIDCSDLLEVVHIDTETGKRVDEETVATSPDVLTVEAVGPKSGEPIPRTSIASNPIAPAVVKPSNSSTPVQNTLIIREVPEGIEELHIRELFTFEKCPHIQSLHLDVANCWFVTMDTTSKDDMIHVLLELRSKKFPSGESVKARLKSAVVLSTDGAPVDFRYTNTDAHMLFEAQIQGDKKTAQGNAGKKRKSGANKGKSNAAQNKNAKGGKINGNTQRRSNSGTNVPKQNNKKNGSKQEDRPKAPPQAPPSLGEDHFPSLSNDDIMNKNKIEVEKLPDQRPEDEMEKARTSSDSASTATTTSSSSSSKNAPSSSQQFIGGYAAALLKAAPPMKAKPVEQKQPLSEKTPISGKKDDKKSSPLSKDRNTRKEGAKKNTNKKAIDGQSTSAIAVSVQPPKWGGGLSFADVLRKEAAAAVAAAPQKSSS